MNRISFKGSRELVEDFAERFLEIHAVAIEPAAEVRELFGSRIEEVSRRSGVEVRHLENAVDFLFDHGVPAEAIENLFEGGGDGAAALAGDVAVLEMYLEDGTIVSVETVDEKRF